MEHIRSRNISGPPGRAGNLSIAAGYAGGGTHPDRTPLPLDQTVRFFNDFALFPPAR